MEAGKKTEHSRREVERLVGNEINLKDFLLNCIYSGVSLYKQAFSTGEEFKLLVREQTCCCKACLLGNFERCDIKASIIRL